MVSTGEVSRRRTDRSLVLCFRNAIVAIGRALQAGTIQDLDMTARRPDQALAFQHVQGNRDAVARDAQQHRKKTVSDGGAAAELAVVPHLQPASESFDIPHSSTAYGRL